MLAGTHMEMFNLSFWLGPCNFHLERESINQRKIEKVVVEKVVGV